MKGRSEEREIPTFIYRRYIPEEIAQIYSLDFRVPNQLLTTGQPYVRGDYPLMKSQHQRLVFQVLMLRFFHIPPLIQITPICAGKVSGVLAEHIIKLLFQFLAFDCFLLRRKYWGEIPPHSTQRFKSLSR